MERKFGEWKEYVENEKYVEAAYKYIQKGCGTHNADEVDKFLGLKEVYVGFFNSDGEVISKLVVQYLMEDGRTEDLFFDIDFTGFGD